MTPATSTSQLIDELYWLDPAEGWLERVADRLAATGVCADLVLALLGPCPLSAGSHRCAEVLDSAARGRAGVALWEELLASRDRWQGPWGACWSVRRYASRGPVVRHRDAIDRAAPPDSVIARAARRVGIADAVVLCAGPARRPSMVAAVLAGPPIDAATFDLLARLQPHLAVASQQAQRVLMGAHSGASYATAVATPEPALRSVVGALEEVRHRHGPLRPDEALSLRTELVSGAWILLDTWRGDGTRYWVAVEDPGGDARLTARQRQILALLLTGVDDREIAHRLGISPGTVGTHARDLASRLGVRGRTGILQTLRSPQRLFAAPE